MSTTPEFNRLATADGAAYDLRKMAERSAQPAPIEDRNMTDKELLDAAATAAGIEGDPSTAFGGWPCIVTCRGSTPWQPLHDDGDALRLAVGLRMLVDDIRKGYMSGHVVAVCSGHAAYEPREPDAGAATRRAIVRAAAANAAPNT